MDNDSSKQDESSTALISAVRSKAERCGVERMAAPAPGTYWRLRADFAGQHDDRCRANAMPAGTVLLLASIKYADGDHHAYVFAPHPGWATNRQISPTFHAEDLYRLWEPAPDGEQVRARELAELLGEMEETKAVMLAPPPDAVPAALLGHDPSAEVGAPGQELVSPAGIASMEAYAEQVQRDAEARSKWISTHSKVLAEQGTQMARFHGERAQSALAKASAQLESVKGLLKTVENLHLYTGRGVSVTALRDGSPAGSAARVTVYQELLSLDEETLALLDAGGLDHTQVEELSEALQDPELVARMIPAPRGMVLCRFRSSDKSFFKGNDTASAIANVAMNAASQETMLLVRDGERLWIVQLENVLKGLKQLMPSRAEQDGYFAESRWREPPKRITKDHIAYADAQQAQMGRLDQYGKVLIALWGLYDRGEIFEGCSIPRFSNWLDPAFQSRYMALVSLDSLIAVSRPTFSAWQGAHNQYLASGAWVAVDVGQAVCPTFAPGAFGQGRYNHGLGRTEYPTLYRPDLPSGSGTLVARVKSDTRGHYVEVPARYDGWRDSDRRVNIKVYLRHEGAGEPSAENRGFLVLDRIRSGDLDYYLTSREQRRNYAQYIKLFREARAWAAARDAAEQPLRERLVAAVVDGGLPHDPHALEGLVTEALAIARTARRASDVPDEGTAAFNAFWKAALAALHAMLVGHGDRIAAIDRWASAAGREPLRLVLSGKDVWRLYLVPTDGEACTRLLGPAAHATTASVVFDGAEACVTPDGMELLRPSRGEQIIHDWGQAGAWAARAPKFKIRFEQARELIEMTSQARLPRTDNEAELMAFVAGATRFMRARSKGSVTRCALALPVGFAMESGDTPCLLLAAIDAHKWAYARGSEAVKARVRKDIESIYAHPERHVEALSESKWALCRWSVDYAWKHRHDWSLGMEGGWARVRQEDVIDPAVSPAESDLRRRTQMGSRTPSVGVAAVTPVGAALIPWLANVTERALQ